MCNNNYTTILISFYLLFHSTQCYIGTLVKTFNPASTASSLFGRNKNILVYTSSSSSSSSSSLLSLSLSSNDSITTEKTPRNNIKKNEDENDIEVERNVKYIKTLLTNLSSILDQYMISKLPADSTKKQVKNILQLIQRESKKKELLNDAIRMIQRAGIEVNVNETENGKRDTEMRNEISFQRREDEIQARKEWEERNDDSDTSSRNPDDINEFIDDKKSLHEEMEKERKDAKSEETGDSTNNIRNGSNGDIAVDLEEGEQLASELIAKAGAKLNTFSGTNLGIGGLDDILEQIKRRVWVPLSVPPIILHQLGIQPVRGLLLYGKPGCGKTLIGRTLGKILSPARPITIVSGPEIMEKYIGSSEANIRNLFDAPPDLYPHIQEEYSTKENPTTLLSSLSKTALHVIIMDEIDAIARSRGNDNQGDAGIARDSVVNQLLAKMDGVQELTVPTLVIGLTNRRSLMDDALLRAGRFEVQIEVPPPKNTEQRVSILNVHMKHMYQSGRVLVSDAPNGTIAYQTLKELNNDPSIPTYNELVYNLATNCTKSMSGASIASICRAAASHALERAVYDFENLDGEELEEDHYYKSIMNCLVTKEDFEFGLRDVLENMSGDDDESIDYQEGDEEKDEEDRSMDHQENDAEKGENYKQENIRWWEN